MSVIRPAHFGITASRRGAFRIGCFINLMLVCAFLNSTVSIVCGQEEETGQATGAEAEIFRRLCVIWESQASDIVSARIKYRQFRPGSTQLRPMSLEEFTTIVNEFDLVKNPDDLRLFEARVLNFKPTWKVAYSLLELVVENQSTAEVLYSDGQKVSQRTVDGSSDVYVDSTNKQADIHLPGMSNMHRTQLRDFRRAPGFRVDSSDELIAAFRVKPLVDNRVSLETTDGRISLLVNLTTGFMYRELFRNAQEQPQSLRLQQGEVLYPGDILFPKVIVQARFKDGIVFLLDLRIIEEAQFNIDISDDAFTANAPTGTNVFDFRKDVSDPNVVKVEKPAKSVIAVAEAAVSRSVGQNSFRSVFVLLNVVLILLLTGFLLRKWLPLKAR